MTESLSSLIDTMDHGVYNTVSQTIPKQDTEVIGVLQYFVRNWTTVLFGNYDLTDKLQVASALDRATKHVFDGEPVIFPIPVDAPAEIPRIILASKDQRYRCNMATNRLEFMYDEPDQPGKELKSLTEPYSLVLRSLAEYLKGELKVSVFRLGFVITNLAFPGEEPVRIIRKTFIRDDILSSSHRLEISILNRSILSAMNDVELNKWWRVSSMGVPTQEGEKQALSVLFDFNTVPEKRYDFGPQFITEFCGFVASQAINDLTILFPQ